MLLVSRLSAPAWRRTKRGATADPVRVRARARQGRRDGQRVRPATK